MSQFTGRENIDNILALSPLQEGMLLQYIKNPNSQQYSVQFMLHLQGEIDESRVERTWNELLRRFAALRTIYRWKSLKQPVQIVLKQHHAQLNIHEGDLEEFKSKDQEIPFDLEKPAHRLTLCRQQEGTATLVISHHHILLDGWSTSVLIRAFLQLYENPHLLGGPASGTEEMKFYLHHLQSLDKQAQASFWKQYLADFTEQPALPGRRDSVSEMTAAGNFTHRLTQSLNDGLKKLAGEQRTTMSVLLFTAWGILLQRYTDQRDVLFGTTVSGRAHERLLSHQQTVGLMINTLPLRVNHQHGDSRQALIDRVSQDVRRREEHEATPLAQIRQYTEMDKSEEMFDTLLVVENYPMDRSLLEQDFSGLRIEGADVEEMTHYPLTIGVLLGEETTIHFSYQEERFEATWMRQLAKHYLAILQALVDQPTASVDSIEIMSETEKNEILLSFNRTDQAYDEHATIDKLISERAIALPNHPAIKDENMVVSYRELEEQANLLAYQLTEDGVEDEEVIGVLLPASALVPIALLGILKSGAAYVPLDPADPPERLAEIMALSGARKLVVDEHTDELIANGPSLRRYVLPQILHSERECSALISRAQPDRLAYIMFTSGTTGKPKGVMIEHRNIVNLANWFGRQFALKPGVHSMQLTSYTFDPSIEDLFVSLAYGACVHIPPAQIVYDAEAFHRYVKQQEIHLINYIPSILAELLTDFPKPESLHTVIAGGERLDDQLKNVLLEKGYRLYNHYGPTETTVDVLSYLCTAEPVQLGKPIDNIRAYVLDSDLRPVPIGVPGELYIAGAGVARGYLDDPVRTANAFILNPSRDSERMYRTGDRVKWTSDGEISWVGRRDHQLKVRGFRIEPGEIETVLLTVPHVREAAVVNKQAGSRTYLQAYVSLIDKTNDAAIGDTLREHVASRLPAYMVPVRFEALEQLPKDRNGKIDRRKLMERTAAVSVLPGTYVAAANATEEVILSIWKDVLGMEEIGVHDDFFDIGGDSHALIRIYGQLQKKFGSNVSVQDLFDYRSIHQLANRISPASEQTAKSETENIQEVEF